MPTSDRSLESILREFRQLGVTRVLIKELAPNDNSKNQIYAGRGFETLSLIPVRSVSTKEPTRPNEKPINFKARLEWSWLGVDEPVAAPGSQLILYPAYPEVRISGFLDGCAVDARTLALMNSRSRGRVLVLGIAQRSRIYAYTGGRNSRIASDWRNFKRRSVDWQIVWRTADDWSLARRKLTRGPGGFFRLELINGRLEAGCIREILERLQQIHRKGWHEGMRLQGAGDAVSSHGPNAGGNTLEYLFGIISNPSKEPDYKGWELKNIDALNDRLTLMTPEPRGGLYADKGVVEFVRRFGYPDLTSRRRKNFSSPHLAGVRNDRTKLTLSIVGYSRRKRKITSNDGGIVLRTPAGSIAAKWNFTDLMHDWNRKHARVVFVPSSSTRNDGRQYNFLQEVAVAEQTDFLRFLSALSNRQAYFDPGTHVVFTRRPRARARSQFRINVQKLNVLYRSFRWVNICKPLSIRGT